MNYYLKENELPLRNLIPSAGFASIFRSLAVIGDSLSSGEHETRDSEGRPGYHDFYEHSWGAYMAREMRCDEYHIFSRGGMTASEFLAGFGDSVNAWDASLASSCYIFALGVNDVLNRGMPVGDATREMLYSSGGEYDATTFAGGYCEIIRRYAEISPKCRMFFVTMPREYGDTPERLAKKEEHARLLRSISSMIPHSAVLDLFAYAPEYDEKFKRAFFLHGHMNSAGYLLTARFFLSYIDYLIRKNPSDYAEAGFFGH